MTIDVPPEALVERPEEAQDISRIIQTIVADERSRRRWQILLTVSPWVISAVFGMFAIGAGIVVARRPIPEPRIEVAIYRSDGSVEAPVDRGKLTQDRKEFIIRADLQAFIGAWESYAWLSNQAFYNRVSVMTSGERLQTEYQETWRNRNNPQNREVKYGKDTTRIVVAASTSYVPGSPFAVTGRALIKTTAPTGGTCEWWAASLTFKQDHNTIPLEKQLTYDPSDVIVVSYASNPLDPAQKPWAC